MDFSGLYSTAILSSCMSPICGRWSHNYFLVLLCDLLPYWVSTTEGDNPQPMLYLNFQSRPPLLFSRKIVSMKPVSKKTFTCPKDKCQASKYRPKLCSNTAFKTCYPFSLVISNDSNNIPLGHGFPILFF